MSDSRPFVLEFGSKVFLPSLAAAAGISMLILYFFSAVFRETDNIDRVMAQESARAVLEQVRQRMESLIKDNAHWDEADQNLRTAGAAEWFSRSWVIANTAPLYDAAFVVDPDGKTLFASLAEDPGNQMHVTFASYFGAAGPSLLSKLAAKSDATAMVSGFLPSRSGVSVAAAGFILPNNEQLPAGAPEPLQLVLAKQLDKPTIDSLARPSLLQDMHFVAHNDDMLNALDVLTPAGDPIAQLAWSKRSSSSILQEKFGPLIWAVQILFLMVVGFLLYLSWRGFSQAHESRFEAVTASLRDELTGLANRRQLMAVLADRLAIARRSGIELTVVYADLDGFKEVNDAYGHEIGDQLLRAVAAGFSFLADKADLVARLGGDEFAIIVSGAGANAAARVLAKNMTAFLAEPMSFGGRIASVSVSAGIVDFEPGIIEIEEILRRADIAMYAAKSSGRDHVQIYDASLDHNRDEARAIARELRQAIDLGKLEVAYQPIVDARSRVIRGAEALVRWPSDSKRKCGPDIFVPIAEKFGLIEELGQLVLAEACRQAAQWPDIFISVNVSPVQFMNPNFANMVARTLRTTRLSPDRLELEVTEGFVIDNAGRATAIIDQLHSMEVKVALDDFGTGYSSIGHLRRFKFDKIKLDRSMVMDILQQPSALRLVQGTVAMADALGLRVTAEGVEDENQVPVLRLAGCSLFQGFLFSRPVDARKMTALLQQDAVRAAG